MLLPSNHLLRVLPSSGRGNSNLFRNFFALLVIPVGAVSLTTSGFALSANIITFDAPGAGTGAFQGTQPFALNAGGSITGPYTDTNFVNHGFLRSADGTIITIDVPNSTFTEPEAINSGRVITGYYGDLNFVLHGWVRTITGAFTSFDPPGSGATFPLAINAAGTIGGNFSYANEAAPVPSIHGSLLPL